MSQLVDGDPPKDRCSGPGLGTLALLRLQGSLGMPIPIRLEPHGYLVLTSIDLTYSNHPRVSITRQFAHLIRLGFC